MDQKGVCDISSCRASANVRAPESVCRVAHPPPCLLRWSWIPLWQPYSNAMDNISLKQHPQERTSYRETQSVVWQWQQMIVRRLSSLWSRTPKKLSLENDVVEPFGLFLPHRRSKIAQFWKFWSYIWDVIWKCSTSNELFGYSWKL